MLDRDTAAINPCTPHRHNNFIQLQVIRLGFLLNRSNKLGPEPGAIHSSPQEGGMLPLSSNNRMSTRRRILQLYHTEVRLAFKELDKLRSARAVVLLLGNLLVYRIHYLVRRNLCHNNQLKCPKEPFDRRPIFLPIWMPRHCVKL